MVPPIYPKPSVLSTEQMFAYIVRSMVRLEEEVSVMVEMQVQLSRVCMPEQRI